MLSCLRMNQSVRGYIGHDVMQLYYIISSLHLRKLRNSVKHLKLVLHASGQVVVATK